MEFDRTPLPMQGRLEMRPIDSQVLRGNALGDAHLRELPVYLPPGVDSKGLPCVFILSAFTGTPFPLMERHPWKMGALWKYERAVMAGEVPPAMIVMPDTFTRLGGSQFVNSSAVGRYEDHMIEEVLPFVQEHYAPDPNRRIVVGKSSGGFGALHLAMRHPGLFQVVGSIAGDCHFEYGYGSEMLSGLREIEKHEGGAAGFLKKFMDTHKLDGDGHAALNLLAMSACYSPNPDSPLGFDLPVDLHTGRRKDEVWLRWLTFDPVVACASHSTALSQLKGLYLEAGKRDEFHLQFSLRILVQELNRLGIPHDHVEFDGGHFGMDARFETVLPKLLGYLDRA
ncbi:MAG: alpha/beta hydrolase-fold protein [Planctomycetota bacterium]|nr:alpha/beta hydrolase-fold protein [Planctomycetota bacterium]